MRDHCPARLDGWCPRYAKWRAVCFYTRVVSPEREISGRRDKTRVPSLLYRSQCKCSKCIHDLGKMVLREAYKETAIGTWQLRCGPMSLQVTVGLLCHGILSRGASGDRHVCGLGNTGGGAARGKGRSRGEGGLVKGTPPRPTGWLSRRAMLLARRGASSCVMGAGAGIWQRADRERSFVQGKTHGMRAWSEDLIDFRLSCVRRRRGILLG